LRRIEQKQYIGLIATVLRGIEKINTASSEAAAVMLSECLRAFAAVEEAVCRSVSDSRRQAYHEITNSIKKAIEALAAGMDAGGESISFYIQDVRDSIEQLKQEILDEAEIQYVVLFLPYKASMWDSMESVWLCAKDDPCCITYVAPIPYFDKNSDGSFGEMHYEGNQMPDYVDVADCSVLDLGQLMPDVIYIHNPYDQYNHVTSVHPAFYSAELKKYTQMLVYVSYSIPGVYESAEGAASFCQTSGMYRADVIIAQSQVHKMLLAANGHREEKIAVLGNPKFDYVFRHLKDCRIPDEMKFIGQEKNDGLCIGKRQERTVGQKEDTDCEMTADQEEAADGRWTAGSGNTSGRKKVFLVCISVGSYLLWENIIEMYDMFIGCLLDQYHAAVIYRPHPLLETTIKSMRPHKYKQYMEFLDKYCGRADFVLDLMSDYMPAVCASDCMIGDYSSLCFSYAVTGKPAAMVLWGASPASDLYYAFDYREIYFINVGPFLAWNQLPEDFEKFAADMVNGHDHKRRHRLESFRHSVANLDGTCGEKIHAYVMERIQNRQENKSFQNEA